MKTKISHLGRSTVSVILAVMMLLSTMLIGTVSTVNAASTLQPTTGVVADGYYRIFVTDNYKTNTTHKLFWWGSSKENPANWESSESMNKLDGHNENSQDVYWYDIPSDITAFIIRPSGSKQSVDLTVSDADLKFSNGAGYYISSENNNKYEYAYWDASGLLPQETKPDVADSVALTANLTSVKAGKPVTLTPTVSGEKSNNLTYTYKKISGGAATEVKNADNSLTVTPTVAGTYKYTVTVSADGYSPVTSIEASFTVTDSVKYYIGGRFKGESWNPNRTDMQFVKVDGESNLYKYETNMTVSQLSQNVDNAKQYFFIHTGNGNEKVYYASSDRLGHTFHKNSINNQLTLKYYPTKADDEKNYIKFDDVADSSSNVVLYLDTSDKDNLKLYYSADIEPDYRITGNLSAIGEWNGYDSALKFDTAESDGSYSKVITVTDDDVNNKFFKLIKSENGSDKYYGPNDSTYDIISSNSSVTAYDTFEGSGEGNDFYFSKAGTYKIHYIVKTGKNTPSVWVEENTTKYNVTVAENIKSVASVDKTEAAKGEKVTVTATPETGKVLDTVTVVGENGSTPIETTVSGNTATFTMPDQDVTVTNVTFRTANTYTVKFSSSDNTFGTVSAKHNGADFNSGTTVTEGDEVTFTAKPKSGYALSDWTVNGVSASSTANPYTITVQKDTTVTANFKVEDSGTIVNNMYFLYGSTNNPTSWEGQQGYNQSGYGKYNVYEKDGKYIVTLNKEHYKQLYFAFSTSNYYKNMTPKDKLAGVNPDNPVDLRLVTTGKESFNADNTQYVFGMMSIVSENSEYIGDIKIIYDPTANTYTVKATKDSASDTTVNITGKDGTIRAGFTNTGDKKTTAVLGDTTLSITTPDDKIITASDSYKIDGKNRAVTAKKVPYGSTVTVTTTIDPDATFAGHNGSDYYVKGFSVNGIFG